MSTKPAQVFAVPELLEFILLELPAKDLLLAQRINTTFRDAITKSLKIQRALFFQPDPAVSQARRVNPLLDRIMAIACGSQAVQAHLCTEPPIDLSTKIVPELAGEHLHVRVLGAAHRKVVGDGADANVIGSWQRMMASDPAVHVYVEDAFLHRRSRHWAPLTMGALVAKLGAEHLGVCDGSCGSPAESFVYGEFVSEEDEEGDQDAVLEVLDGAADDGEEYYDDAQFDDDADYDEHSASAISHDQTWGEGDDW